LDDQKTVAIRYRSGKTHCRKEPLEVPIPSAGTDHRFRSHVSVRNGFA